MTTNRDDSLNSNMKHAPTLNTDSLSILPLSLKTVRESIDKSCKI